MLKYLFIVQQVVLFGLGCFCILAQPERVSMQVVGVVVLVLCSALLIFSSKTRDLSQFNKVSAEVFELRRVLQQYKSESDAMRAMLLSKIQSVAAGEGGLF